VTTRAKAPLFVVADTHGEFEIFADMLIRHHVVDGKLHWSFGRGYLVILGDVFDRGAHQTEILWLIYALEAEARKAGGGVAFVLGNHETMVMRGDLRYLNPRYQQTAAVLGVASYTQLFGPGSVLGQWLRSKAAVVKVNDLLCLHGGISRELVEAQAFAGRHQRHGEVGAQRRSAGQPTPNVNARSSCSANSAHCGIAAISPRLLRRRIECRRHRPDPQVLRRDAHSRRHTRVPSITPLFTGKVIAVQVYPRHREDGSVEFEALSDSRRRTVPRASGRQQRTPAY
jgi:hypothetical protein